MGSGGFTVGDGPGKGAKLNLRTKVEGFLGREKKGKVGSPVTGG